MKFNVGDRVKHTITGSEGSVYSLVSSNICAPSDLKVGVQWDDGSIGWAHVAYVRHLIHVPTNPHPLKIDRTEVADQVRTLESWAFKYGVSYALTGKIDPISPKSTELWDEVQRIEKQMADEYSTYLELKRKFEGEGK